MRFLLFLRTGETGTLGQNNCKYLFFSYIDLFSDVSSLTINPVTPPQGGGINFLANENMAKYLLICHHARGWLPE